VEIGIVVLGIVLDGRVVVADDLAQVALGQLLVGATAAADVGPLVSRRAIWMLSAKAPSPMAGEPMAGAGEAMPEPSARSAASAEFPASSMVAITVAEKRIVAILVAGVPASQRSWGREARVKAAITFR